MDTRLNGFLPAALGLCDGDAKTIKNTGDLDITDFDSAIHSLTVVIYGFGVDNIIEVAHPICDACHMSCVYAT